MEPSRDEVLFATLESLRPAPSPAFAAELDARAADGFPRRSASGVSPLPKARAWLSALRPRQWVLAGGGVALATVAVAAVLVANSTSSHLGMDLEQSGVDQGQGVESSAGGAEEVVPANPRHLNQTPKRIEEAFGAAGSSASSAGTAEAEAPPKILPFSTEAAINDSYNGTASYTPSSHQRDVQRSAQIVLGTEPAAVDAAAAKVYTAVHDYRGIVLSSSVNGGSEAGSARFEMLIPSAKLSDALAAFSEVAEVRYRHEGTLDITAPTVTTADALRDSQARIDSLLNELAATETEAEREAVETQLRGERRHAAALKSNLSRLERRADFSFVSLRIKSDDPDAPTTGSSGGWDVGDAFHDAGHILAVAAGVAIVGLAVIGPLALIALLVWLANRAWVRQRRERALG
jgi:hypothetical protein